MRTKFSKIAFLAVLGLALTFTFSCSGGDDSGGNNGGSSGGSSSPSGSSPSGGIKYGEMKDDNGKTYKTVKIGDQTWMAENLNFDVPDNNTNVCWKNEPDNCQRWGKLYNWATAMGIDNRYTYEEWNGSDVKHRGICPSGWHIPSDADWDVLITAVGGKETAGTKLKATSSEGGTDEFGFAALLGGGGYGYPNNRRFYSAGSSGFWWSSTEHSSRNAYRSEIRYDKYAYSNEEKENLYSVRCVKDN